MRGRIPCFRLGHLSDQPVLVDGTKLFVWLSRAAVNKERWKLGLLGKAGITRQVWEGPSQFE